MTGNDTEPLRLPTASGELSGRVRDHLTGRSAGAADAWRLSLRTSGDFWDADFQRLLWMLEMVDIDRFVDVDPDVAASRSTVALRHSARSIFRRRARQLARLDDRSIETILAELARPPAAASSPTTPGPGPDGAQVRQRLLDKTPYLAWEADAHTLALARAPRSLQRPIAEIQAGEYGVGHRRTHAQIFRSCVDAVGSTLQDALDGAPAPGFALANSALVFSSDISTVGAAIGQLCAFELDSVEPCRRRIAEWDDVGLAPEGRRWYDVHALADIEHADVITEQVLPALAAMDDTFRSWAKVGAVTSMHLFAMLAAQHEATIDLPQRGSAVASRSEPRAAVDDSTPTAPLAHR